MACFGGGGYCIFEKLTSYLGYKTPFYSSQPQHILKCNRKFNQIAIVGMRTFLCSRLGFFSSLFFSPHINGDYNEYQCTASKQRQMVFMKSHLF